MSSGSGVYPGSSSSSGGWKMIAEPALQVVDDQPIVMGMGLGMGRSHQGLGLSDYDDRLQNNEDSDSGED
jgi:hypothetical protein